VCSGMWRWHRWFERMTSKIWFRFRPLLEYREVEAVRRLLPLTTCRFPVCGMVFA
jgi:hypothetical protein